MASANGIDIKPEGVGPREDKPADVFEGPPLREKIPGAASLTELAKEYVFFSPGLLYTHGGLDRDPVQEFVNESPDDVQVAVMRFDKPLFNGLRFADGRIDWNHMLLVAERGQWDALRKALGTVGIIDSKKKIFYRSVTTSVVIADPVIMDKATVIPHPIPEVEVIVFALDGNTRQVLVAQPQTLLGTPSVVIKNPQKETAEFAKRLFAGDPNPAAGTGDPATQELFRQFQKGKKAA